MMILDQNTLELAFTASDAPRISDVIRSLAAGGDLSATRRRDLVSGLRRVARVLGHPPEEVPADPRWLQPRLARVLPAAHGMSPKSWTNAVSDARSALARVGIVTRRTNRAADLDEDWHELWQAVLASKDRTLQPALCRFVHFLNRIDVRPGEVCDAHASAYLSALELNEISKSPQTAYRAAVNGWNLATRRIDTWPGQQLVLPSRRKPIALAPGALPPSFTADLQRFLDRLANPDPLDPDARELALSPVTIELFRTKTIKFAGAVVRSGVPVEEMTCLADLVRPDRTEAGLRWLLDRSNGKTTRDIDQVATLMTRIGREHADLSAVDQDRLDEMARRLHLPHRQGMTDRNRDRLRPFESPETVRKLLQLPDLLVARARAVPASYSAALLSEEAVAIALLLHCPIRRKNLCSIEFDRHIQRFGDGRVFLVIDGAEVKNGRRIEFELPSALVEMIDRHRRSRVPFLCGAGTPWLFPRRKGTGPLNSDILASRVKRRVEREIGVTINLHLFRHLAAKLYLDARPGAYEVVRRLLGHSELSMTINAYAGFEAGTATRLYGDMLAARKLS